MYDNKGYLLLLFAPFTESKQGYKYEENFTFSSFDEEDKENKEDIVSEVEEDNMQIKLKMQAKTLVLRVILKTDIQLLKVQYIFDSIKYLKNSIYSKNN